MKKILSKIKVPDLSAAAKPVVGLGDAVLSGVGDAFDKVTATFDTGVGVLRSHLGGIPFFGSTATSKFYALST